MNYISNSKLNIIGLLLITLIYACGESQSAEKKETTSENSGIDSRQLKNTKPYVVKESKEDPTLILTGRVSYDENKVAKVFPLVSGNVLEVHASLGDPVTKGEELAVLRSPEINELQSQYQISLANHQVAKRNLDIAQELYKTNVSSEKDLLSVQNEFKKADGDVNRIKQQLSIYGSDPNTANAFYRVLAPSDGYIVEKNINENMEVRSDNSSNIFTVASLKTVWIIADVYETEIAKIKLNEKVEITTLAYPDKVFRGTISQVGNFIDPQTKTLKIRIVMDNTEGMLKPGMFARIAIHFSEPRKLLSVPASSIVFDNNKNYVIKQQGNSQLAITQVTIDKTVNGIDYILEGENLRENDVVLTNNVLFMYTDLKIK